MSYVPGFVSEKPYGDIFVGMLGGYICFCVVMMLLAIFQKFDRELRLTMTINVYAKIMIICVIAGGCIVYRHSGEYTTIAVGFLMLIYLMTCSITDYYIQQIYDVIQLWMCIFIGCLTLRVEAQPSLGVELLVFAVVQGLLFLRMYGEADVMGFLVCALSLAGKGLLIWLIHMALTFLFLGIVQGWKGNIASDGNLKVPVALFPYMAASYVLVF